MSHKNLETSIPRDDEARNHGLDDRPRRPADRPEARPLPHRRLRRRRWGPSRHTFAFGELIAISRRRSSQLDDSNVSHAPQPPRVHERSVSGPHAKTPIPVTQSPRWNRRWRRRRNLRSCRRRRGRTRLLMTQRQIVGFTQPYLSLAEPCITKVLSLSRHILITHNFL